MTASVLLWWRDNRTPHRGVRRRIGNKDNPLFLRIESGNKQVQASQFDSALLLCAGNDPFTAVNAAVVMAAKLSGTARPLGGKKLPRFVDVLGWCTWDAFYSKVSAKSVVQGVQHLREAGV